MSFFQPLKRVSAKSLSLASGPNLDAKTTMGSVFDQVCESKVASPRLQTGSWWGSNPEGGATIIYLEAMETAALWKGVEKPNNNFPPPFHRAWKTLRPKRSEFPTVPTASATGYRFVLKCVSHDLFFCPVENSSNQRSQFSTATTWVGMQFLKNLNPCSFYSLATVWQIPV